MADTGAVIHREAADDHRLRRDIGIIGLLFTAVGSIIGSGWLFGALSAAQIAGPAAIIYWLGGPNSAQVIRANLMVYFAVLAIVSAAIYYVRGLFTADVLILSILLGPVFILAMAIGARMFRGASDVAYRRVAYAIIALSAIVSVPLFDELFR